MLTSVHSRKPASPSRVSASCSTSLHMLSFWLQSARTILRALLPTPLTVPARIGAITSLSIRAVGNCLVVLLVGCALQPARVPSYHVLVVLCAKAQHVLSQESVVAGRVFAESRELLNICGQKLSVNGPPSSTLSWASWSGCARVRLSAWAQRGLSRQHVVVAEQFRSLPRSTTFESLSMGSQDRARPEPWPLPLRSGWTVPPLRETFPTPTQFHAPSAPCRLVPPWRERSNQHSQFAHAMCAPQAPSAPPALPIQSNSVWPGRVSPLPSASRVAVSRPAHAAVAFFGVSPPLQTTAHSLCRSPPVVSGFIRCTSSWPFVPCPLLWPGSRTVEFGPSTRERLRSLRCTRTSET